MRGFRLAEGEREREREDKKERVHIIYIYIERERHTHTYRLSKQASKRDTHTYRQTGTQNYCEYTQVPGQKDRYRQTETDKDSQETDHRRTV